MSTTFIGYMTKFFGSGQRQNGWFAGIFTDSDTYKSVHVSGVHKKTIDPKVEYEIECEEVHHPTYGLQYNVISMRPHVSLDRDSLIQYLSGATFKGIGKAVATKIVDAFGADSLNVITKEPERLSDELQLTDRQIEILQKGELSTTIESRLRKVLPFITETLIEKIINAYCDGQENCDVEDIIQTIKSEPYQLLYKLERVSFQEIDKIALHVGYNEYGDSRLQECYKYVLHQYLMETQNTFLDTSDLNDYNAFYNNIMYNIGYLDLERNRQTLGQNIYSQVCIDVVNGLFANPSQIDGIRIDFKEDGTPILYNQSVYEEERGLSEIIAKCLLSKSVFMSVTGCTLSDIENDIAIYEKKNGLILDDSQRKAVMSSLMSSISIINGGPGHGKTTTIDCVLFIWDKQMRQIAKITGQDEEDIKLPILSAPTGRAVSVLKQATGNQYEVATAMRRITLMSKLVKAIDKKKEKKEKDAVLSADLEIMSQRYSNTLVILDESSMAGIKLVYQYMKLFTDCQFIFVGDVNQLPSIEYGQFFKDLCDCNIVMQTELTVNHRVGSDGALIVDNADEINNGNINLDYSDEEQFSMVEATNDYSQLIKEEYLKYVSPNGQLDVSRMKDVGILCPIKKDATGVLELNYDIQNIVNPVDYTAAPYERGYEIEATHVYINNVNKDVKLRVGDRVMQTKNRAEAECIRLVGTAKRECDNGIFNGDIGTITKFIPAQRKEDVDMLEILFDDGRETVIEEEFMKELTLAYAITIHKAQGSEYPMVIISMPEKMTILSEKFANKNLFYTAITRAKKCVKIFGSTSSVNKCIITTMPPRNSMLTPKILQEIKYLKAKG